MAEYIEKQDAVDYCKALMNAEVVQNTDDWGYGKERYNQTEVILEFIENRQPADVTPVVHARWIKYTGMGKVQWMCSKCSAEEKNPKVANYCYHCGARMDAYGEE